MIAAREQEVASASDFTVWPDNLWPSPPDRDERRVITDNDPRLPELYKFLLVSSKALSTAFEISLPYTSWLVRPNGQFHVIYVLLVATAGLI